MMGTPCAGKCALARSRLDSGEPTVPARRTTGPARGRGETRGRVRLGARSQNEMPCGKYIEFSSAVSTWCTKYFCVQWFLFRRSPLVQLGPRRFTFGLAVGSSYGRRFRPWSTVLPSQP